MPHAASRWCRAAAAGGLACWLVAQPAAPVLADWTITPQIGGQEAYTDNVLLTPTNRRSDLITTLSPSLSINGASARLEGSFNYSPTAYLYALTPALNAVGQNLYANGTATLVPDLFFLDAHGYASLQPTSPGFATAGLTAAPPALGANFGGIGTGVSTAIPTSQLTQVTGFDASPYLVRRFDGFGSAELRYTVSDTNFSGARSNPFAPPGFAVQNTTALTNEGTAAFLTGENFGPFASRVVLDAAQSSGTGVLQASQDIAVSDSAYAITPRLFALGSLGYEHLRWSGLPPIRIDDAIWGIGARLTPRPQASLTVTYGHRYGVTAPYLSLYYALTARTSVTATYSEGLATTAQEIADNLAISEATATGRTVDARTLLPLAIVNPALGLQSGLFRIRQVTGTVFYTLPRDHVSLSAYHISNALVAQSAPGLGISQNTTGGNALWTRDLNPLTTASLGAGYSHFSYPTQPQFAENLLTVGVSVNYLLTRSLTGWAGYSFFRRTSPQPQLRLLANVIFVGLSKAF
jgi:uncharacterized protein (PEP-CTERM system associated)